MQKNNKVLGLVSAVVALVFMSGCTSATSSAPVAKVEKSFKKSFQVSDLQSAVESAASENGWSVVASNSGNIELKKTFVTYKRQSGTNKRWKRVKQECCVTTVVSIAKNKLSIAPTNKSVTKMKKLKLKDTFNESFAKLEKDVYTNLVEHVL